MFEVDDTNRRVNKYTPCPKSPFMPNMSIVRRCSICARSCTAHLGFHGPLKRTFTKVCKNHQVTRPVQKHKRTQDWRAGPFRSSSPCGEPQIRGVSEAMSAIRVLRTRRGKHRPATGCYAPWAKTWIQVLGKDGTLRRPGPHLDQNVLGQLRGSSPGPDSEPLGRPLFPPPAWPDQRPLPNLGRCCTARSKSLTSLCRLQSHPAQYVSGIPSAAILLSISHPIRCSTRCLANVRARISGPMIAL